MTRLFDSISGAQKALEYDNIPLARRYVSNALEQLQCVICHEEMLLSEQDEEHVHFKGYAHTRCTETYGNRRAYEEAHR